MNFTVDEIIEATDAELIRGAAGEHNRLIISTDSRNVSSNEIYLPLKGERFDGEDFISSAVSNGAIGYFVSNKSKIEQNSKLVFLVEDTKIAYLKLARFYKREINPITIAITGSSGKTTTKEMMHSVASEAFKTHKSILNHNNEIGLCQTLLSMPEDTQILIVEMGMRALGEIELLSEYSEPDIAIIANVGSAHIGRLGSLDNIARAKCEIVSHLNKEGILFAHDNELIKKNNQFEGKTCYFSLLSKDLSNIKLSNSGSTFDYKGQSYKLNTEGEYNIQNAIAVIEAGLKLGINADVIASGLLKYQPIEKRWELNNVCGFNIINDSYNANPESVKAAAKTFLECSEGKKILVLGDMGELGEHEVFYHKEIGRFLEGYNFDGLITIGTLASYIEPANAPFTKKINSCKEAAAYIKESIEEGANIFLKASRSMKFEEIIEELSK